MAEKQRYQEEMHTRQVQAAKEQVEVAKEQVESQKQEANGSTSSRGLPCKEITELE